MNIVIFGATGGTGRHLMKLALEQGHVVRAFARNPDAITDQHERLTTVLGNVLDAASVEAAVAGQDAVLSALGTRKLGKHTTISTGTSHIIAAMDKHGVRRLICETSLGVGDSRGQPNWFFNRIILSLFLRNAFADKEVQEQMIMRSGLDWVIVRPGRLTHGPETGKYLNWVGQNPSIAKGVVSRADVAGFMLKQLTEDTYLRKAVAISY